MIALTVDVFDRTGSGAWVSALLIADFLPIILIGFLFAPLVDRLSRRRLLIVSDLVRVAIFCVLPFAGSAAAIVALAALAGIATGFFRPAVYAGLPNLVDDDELPNATSLLQTVDNLTWMVGPVAGGILIAVQGPDLAYWLNALTFLFSAALLARIPAARMQAGTVESRGHWRDIGDGISIVLRSPALLTVLVAWNMVMFGNAAINVAEVVLAKVSLDSGDVGFGVLVGAGGLGLTIGSFAAGTFVERFGMSWLYGIGIALMALGYGIAAVAPTIAVAVPAVILASIGNGAAVVCNALLVQRGAPDELRGRAFTVIMSSNYALLGLGMVAAGALTDAFGARWVWGGAAAAYLVAALVAFAFAPRAREGARVSARRAWTLDELAAGVRSGDRRALARAISLVENGDPLSYALVRELYPETGSAFVVGVTGPPGVGKSSLISTLVRHIRTEERSVGVISVDPSSPFTHGALLGDRIRLADHFLDPGVFIRSMGTRGHLGGLSEATLQAALLLDAAGKELVLLETVGAGQSEVEVIGIADTVLLVLMPGSGDSVQALKAGIMEIPDVIAINKMDHPAAKTMLNEVRSILALDRDRAWRPPIVLTEALRGENVPELWGQDRGAPRVPRVRRAAGGAAAEEPCRRGVRGRDEPGKVASAGGGGGEARVAPAARRGAGPEARPALGRA